MPRVRGLVRARTSGPGWTRRRAGRGFVYLDEDGTRIDDPEVVERLKALVLPPAWRDVWFAPDPRSHILATGVDDAGRRQYVYHPRWVEAHDRAKHARTLELAERLPQVRRRVTRDLRAEPGSLERALAVAVRLVDSTHLRVGSERHTAATGNRGLTTLLCEHVRVEEGVVTLEFRGKSGQVWHTRTVDEDLADAVASLLERRSPRARLLARREGRSWRPVRASDVNRYIQEISGTACTAKDFRTLHGSIIAARELARIGWSPDERERTRTVRAAVVRTSELLGNTPAVAKSSYIDPAILDRFHASELIDLHRGDANAYLTLMRGGE